jgi:hypothetical protein
MRDRAEAVRRGLEFIYRTARDPENFSTYGFDYTFCLHWIASTSRDTSLRRAARAMAVECARRWRRENPTVPLDADAETVARMVFGGLSADRLGLRDAAFRREVRRGGGAGRARDLVRFDPPGLRPVTCRPTARAAKPTRAAARPVAAAAGV